MLATLLEESDAAGGSQDQEEMLKAVAALAYGGKWGLPLLSECDLADIDGCILAASDTVGILNIPCSVIANMHRFITQSASALGTFFLAMAKYPEIQKKAQAEIDEIVGLDRLPNVTDRGSMPYVEALYREILRWKPVTPLALPHAASADGVYNGMFIPKGD